MADATIARPARAPRSTRALDLKYQPGFGTMAILCLVMLYAPILVLVFFSFNENRSVAVFTTFSLKWYYSALQDENIRAATWISLKVAMSPH